MLFNNARFDNLFDNHAQVTTPGPRIRRIAEKVLELVRDAGTITEAPIRAALGNNADVSKAVRWLVKRKEIDRMRGFRGGKHDAFRYTVSIKSVNND